MTDTTGKRILWHSVSPLCPTGYGGQTALFAPRLAKAGYEMAISSGFGINGRVIEYDGLQVYPGFDWNQQVLDWRDLHAGDGKALTITLMDLWPLDQQLFAHINQTGGLACWTPVDHAPMTPGVTAFLQATKARPIAMSKFGENELRVAGFDPLFVPHGVDTDVFKPLDREGCRRLFNLPNDMFIVGIVANNEGVAPPRKAFPQAFAAFKDFHDTHPNSRLYLHAETTGNIGLRQGVDLRIIAAQFEIPQEAIIHTSPTKMLKGMPPSHVAALYNSFDVLLNASYGEGFGVPIIEAQACGTPVVVSDWTAMPELCGAGWKVSGEPWYDCQHYSWFLNPSVTGITEALTAAAEMPAAEMAALRETARTFAMGYDADHVMDTYWKPVLEELHKPREVPPLVPLNHEARRRLAKQEKAAA